MRVEGFEIEGVIKVSNARVLGLEESIVASSYPMVTDTGDMDYEVENLRYWLDNGLLELYKPNEDRTEISKPHSDKYDLKKAMRHFERICKLGNAIPGSGHDCAGKGITLQFDLQVPEYIWRQLDRYHFIDYVSSQSKMHRITKLDLDKCCNKYVDEVVVENLSSLIDVYNKYEKLIDKKTVMRLRNGKTVMLTKEELFNIIISNTPSGIMLTARMTTNYLQLKSIVNQRSKHKMQEWRYLCEWFRGLPLAKEIIFADK